MKIAVIGSGIGGLATACRLALKGHKVVVYEKNKLPGGKLSEIKEQGFRFDTGPSLFTLPDQIDELFKLSGEGTAQNGKYIKLDTICKYFFESGKILSASANPEVFKHQCEEVLGEKAKNIEKHLNTASLLYKQTANIFIFNSLHKLKNFLKLSVFKSLLQVRRLRVTKTMHEVNSKRFISNEAVQIFDRYATYNGSNPYWAPATLNIIAHLENNLGAFFPEKGMYSIVEELYELAKSKGVEFKFDSLVTQINVKNKTVDSITIDNDTHNYDLIISNTDVNYLIRNMMRHHPLKNRLTKLEPSSSALIFYWGINKEFAQLDLHNILFSANYKEEFDHYFTKKTIYSDPTVYIFISSKIVKTDAPKGSENWFVMVNAPYNSGQNWDQLINDTRKNIVHKINSRLNTDIEKHIVFEKIGSPVTIEKNTLSHRGALYGNSSNSKFSAFLRHPNFLRKIKNLYFVGGSVHPGGGIPLCLAGAKIVDNEIPKA